MKTSAFNGLVGLGEPRRRKLLILAQDPRLRGELAAMFADLDVVCCESSGQILALVRRVEPDVVLFDLCPGNVPGSAEALELLRQILALARDTKVIAMTESDARDLA